MTTITPGENEREPKPRLTPVDRTTKVDPNTGQPYVPRRVFRKLPFDGNLGNSATNIIRDIEVMLFDDSLRSIVDSKSRRFLRFVLEVCVRDTEVFMTELQWRRYKKLLAACAETKYPQKKPAVAWPPFPSIDSIR
jgi:hypothetical protein